MGHCESGTGVTHNNPNPSPAGVSLAFARQNLLSLPKWARRKVSSEKSLQSKNSSIQKNCADNNLQKHNHLFTHYLNSLFPSQKPAFTLAEVLVTLGIIGIIAAMTLPSLIKHYKQKVLQEQFKVGYSLFQQAYLKIQADWGYTPDCYYWDNNPYGGVKCIAYDDRGGCIKNALTDGSELPKNYNGNMEECKVFYKALEKTL